MIDNISHTKADILQNRIIDRKVSSLCNVARTENSCKEAVNVCVNLDTRVDTFIPVNCVI
jgi:hypothetical protein